MCSRFYVDNDILSDIADLFPGRLPTRFSISPHDVYPGQSAPIIAAEKSNIEICEMKWGFPQYKGKGLFINARSETALSKRTFSESVVHRRCAIPARKFYEWDASKNKVSFLKENESPLYMAGFFNLFQNEKRFVILTTQANASVQPVHERMHWYWRKKKQQTGFAMTMQ